PGSARPQQVPDAPLAADRRPGLLSESSPRQDSHPPAALPLERADRPYGWSPPAVAGPGLAHRAEVGGSAHEFFPDDDAGAAPGVDFSGLALGCAAGSLPAGLTVDLQAALTVAGGA